MVNKVVYVTQYCMWAIKSGKPYIIKLSQIVWC